MDIYSNETRKVFRFFGAVNNVGRYGAFVTVAVKLFCCRFNLVGTFIGKTELLKSLSAIGYSNWCWLKLLFENQSFWCWIMDGEGPAYEAGDEKNFQRKNNKEKYVLGLLALACHSTS